MEKHLLSKTSYIRGLQCRKALFLYRHYPQLRDPISPERQAQFSRGIDVGLLARELFPGGIDATAGLVRKYDEAVERTRALMEEGTDVIYEAAFRHEGVLVFADILVRNGQSWRAYEVKSSLRVSNVHVNDAALQYYVINGSGLALDDFSLVHVNPSYVRSGPLDLKNLFRTVSLRDDVLAQQELIAQRVQEMKAVLGGQQIPEQAIGDHCFSPYPCDFMGQCWKPLPTDSIFGLTGLSRSEAFRLYSSGVQLITDVQEMAELNDMARAQVHSMKTQSPLINAEKLQAFFSSLHYPLLFLDVETFMPAVPRYEGTKPFQHLPFQYSIHRIETPGAEPQHFSFIAEPGADPRKEFVEQLLNDTQGEGSIIAYDATMERSTFASLKSLFPAHAPALAGRISRLRDLMQPFMEQAYHHASMKGSVSLKNVLPALVPGMSYDTLKITNGSQAMSVYERLHEEQDLFTMAEMKEALHEYGRLDTLAMVEILKVLENAIRGEGSVG